MASGGVRRRRRGRRELLASRSHDSCRETSCIGDSCRRKACAWTAMHRAQTHVQDIPPALDCRTGSLHRGSWQKQSSTTLDHGSRPPAVVAPHQVLCSCRVRWSWKHRMPTSVMRSIARVPPVSRSVCCDMIRPIDRRWTRGGRQRHRCHDRGFRSSLLRLRHVVALWP